MTTLHELANKLQAFIINQQVDAHNARHLNVAKYNNLKLKIAQLPFPNIVICIGISEVTYNIDDCTKVDGGLGQDEKHVRKWLSKSANVEIVKQLYLELTDLVDAEEELKEEVEDAQKIMLEEEPRVNKRAMEGKADRSKFDTRTLKYRKATLPENAPFEAFEYNPEDDETLKDEYANSINNPNIPAFEEPSLEDYGKEYLGYDEPKNSDLDEDDN